MSIPRNGFISWLDKRVVDPLLQILRRYCLFCCKFIFITMIVQKLLTHFAEPHFQYFEEFWAFDLLIVSSTNWLLLLFSYFLSLLLCDDEMFIPTPSLSLSLSQRETEPKQLAFSASVGLTLGIFPICGVTVFLCGMAIALLGSHCHSPTVLLANFVATPIELSLVVPFLRLGESICGGPHFPLTSDVLKRVLTGKASHEVLLSIVHALFGWLVAAPFVMALLYAALLPCFKILVRKYSVSSPKMP